MTRRYFSSIAQRTTLASSCTDSGTTIVVTAATGFPSSVPFNLVLDPDTVNEEIVTVTSRVGTTCTVTRGVDSTAGVAHSSGAGVRHSAVGQDFNEASEHVNETTTAHGLTLADVITTTNTKTLTNKTLTAPTIADFTNAAHDHGDADDGGNIAQAAVTNLVADLALKTDETSGLLTGPIETVTVSATAATGTINFDCITQATLYYTSNAAANWTLNVRGSSGTTLNTLLATGQSITVTFLVAQGSTAYYQSAFTVDGNSVTPKWQGGTAPTAGNASSVDAYTITIVKTGSAAFTAFAAQTRFA